MPTLPLFPLGTVLLPGATLPLQVFEPRYLALIRDLQDRPDAERAFGVVCIRSGHEVGAGAARELCGVGTSARIEAVALSPQGEPRIGLLTTGARRFRLDGIDDAAGTPYLTGLVTWLEDGPATHGDRELAGSLMAEVTAYRELLDAPPLEAAARALDPGPAAFAAIDAVLLGLGDRQRILDAPDVTSRLRIALGLVRRERALVERLGSVARPAGLESHGLN